MSEQSGVGFTSHFQPVLSLRLEGDTRRGAPGWLNLRQCIEGEIGFSSNVAGWPELMLVPNGKGEHLLYLCGTDVNEPKPVDGVMPETPATSAEMYHELMRQMKTKAEDAARVLSTTSLDGLVGKVYIQVTYKNLLPSWMMADLQGKAVWGDVLLKEAEDEPEVLRKSA